ncbi:hypothetical protein VTI74DRAFT_2648 [Chaetomium olivicolor]
MWLHAKSLYDCVICRRWLLWALASSIGHIPPRLGLDIKEVTGLVVRLARQRRCLEWATRQSAVRDTMRTCKRVPGGPGGQSDIIPVACIQRPLQRNGVLWQRNFKFVRDRPSRRLWGHGSLRG